MAGCKMSAIDDKAKRKGIHRNFWEWFDNLDRKLNEKLKEELKGGLRFDFEKKKEREEE
jgi:hypothetical protein